MNSSPQSSGSSTLAFVRLCPHCEKVFTKEYSYNRHVSYCRRAQTKRKGRPKSCASCSAAKAKCSFDKPQCARCAHKGLACVYDHQKRQLEPFVEAGLSGGIMQPSLGGGMDLGGLNAFPLSDVDNFMDQMLQPEVADSRGNRVSLCQNTDPFGWGLVSETSDSDQEVEYHVMMFGTQPKVPSTWKPTFPDEEVTTLKWDTLTTRPLGASVADHVANVLLHIIRSFPQMMLRRETFPPYIHKHWYRSTLPEKLATCMSISQLFASRTPETRPFLWRTIDAEERRMRDELDTYDAHEILPAVQSLIIYMIMAIIDQYDGTPARGIRLVQTFQTMTIKFRTMLGSSCFAETEYKHQSMGWEDWVFQESRRRLANLWFVISRVLTSDADLPCPDMLAFREMPLATGKAMWEARTREEWETEHAFFQASLLHTNMWKFQYLIEARRQPNNPLNSAKLDAWEAETDKMGVLMNIAVSLLGRTDG